MGPRSKDHGTHGTYSVRAGTLVKIRHTGFTSADSARNHAEGWQRVFGWMQAFCERGETIVARVPNQ